jgi:hypothetical protein
MLYSVDELKVMQKELAEAMEEDNIKRERYFSFHNVYTLLEILIRKGGY